MTLSELQPGERFIAASANDKTKADRYRVLDEVIGLSIKCYNETKKYSEYKSARMQIIQLPIK